MTGKKTVLAHKFQDFIEGNGPAFDELALDVFHHQRENNEIYKRFLSFLPGDFSKIHDIEEIPFMPVSFFKKSDIKTGEWTEEFVFESSSTTGTVPSRHCIKDIQHYKDNTAFCFNSEFGPIEDFCFFALLPSYLEKSNSSLVFMLDHFIKTSNCGKFYKSDYQSLEKDLHSYNGKKKIILLGVTYALLEFAGIYSIDREMIVMETGGMKGRGPELPRESVHEILKKSFNIQKVFSEYGMAELLSQSYSKGEGYFSTSPTMKVLISDIYDPFSILNARKHGRVNIIDLANFDTFSFIATDDLGVVTDDNRFKILGRTDESDIRGCNLLYA